MLTLLLPVFPAVLGQEEPTATASPTVAEDEDIQMLKEKVANKVTEIRRKNNRATAGIVQSKSVGEIKIKTNEEEDFIIKLDDALTKYFQILGTSKKEIKSDDIEVGDYIIVTGVLNEKIVSANTIFVDERYLVATGRISQVDKENFTLKVITTAKEEIDLDIENSTKQAMINIKTHEAEASGFTKIKEGDTIHFVVKDPTLAPDKSYSAVKILIIPQEYFIK